LANSFYLFSPNSSVSPMAQLAIGSASLANCTIPTCWASFQN